MKFKVTIIAILTTILVFNTIGLTMIINEEKKQSELAFETKELIYSIAFRYTREDS